VTHFIINNQRRIAVDAVAGAVSIYGADKRPCVMFLGGYFSDMTGTKAQFLATECAGQGRGYTRFDYSGHGQSEGRFREGCIGDWYCDALAVFDQCTTGKQILVGSSMGGWLALKLALERPDRVAAVVGVAAAPVFTEDLVWDLLSADDRARMEREGYLFGTGAEPLVYTHKLVVEGRQHLLLRKQLPLQCPVRLLQGQKDDAVPWQTAQAIQRQMTHDNVQIIFIPEGDHRLSQPQDLALLWQTIESVS
jgi:pimeloyl-ACP methyl ester carboxylesterase